MNDDLSEKLMEVLPFSESDLQSTKQGKLTASQKVEIIKTVFVLFTVIYFCYFFVLLIIGIFKGLNSVTIGMAVLVFLAFSFWLMNILIRTKYHRGVKVVEGGVDFNLLANEEKDGTLTEKPSFSVKVGKKRFWVEEEFLTLCRKEKYEFFILPYS